MTDSSNSASCEVEILKGPSINISYRSLFCCWCITRHIASLNISSLSRQLLGRLSFLVTNDIGSIQAQNGQKSIYFTTDSTLIYTAFFADFGPLDLGLTYQFCQQLHELLKASTAAKKSVVYYCADHLHRRANSAVLLCSYLVRSLSSQKFMAYLVDITSIFCNSMKYEHWECSPLLKFLTQCILVCYTILNCFMLFSFMVMLLSVVMSLEWNWGEVEMEMLSDFYAIFCYIMLFVCTL